MAHGLPREPARHPYSVRQANHPPSPFLGEQHKRSGQGSRMRSETRHIFPAPNPLRRPVSGLEFRALRLKARAGERGVGVVCLRWDGRW